MMATITVAKARVRPRAVVRALAPMARAPLARAMARALTMIGGGGMALIGAFQTGSGITPIMAVSGKLGHCLDTRVGVFVVLIC